MNYIKLHLGGKERGFKLGIGFLRFLDEQTGIKPADLAEVLNDALKVPVIMYHSLKFNALRSGDKEEFNQYDVDEWIDEAGGFQSQIITDFFDALGKSLKIDIPDEGGKNTPQTKAAKK